MYYSLLKQMIKRKSEKVIWEYKNGKVEISSVNLMTYIRKNIKDLEKYEQKDEMDLCLNCFDDKNVKSYGLHCNIPNKLGNAKEEERVIWIEFVICQKCKKYFLTDVNVNDNQSIEE